MIFIVFIIAWYVLGVTGTIQFFRLEIDVDVAGMILAFTLGGFLGPITWIMASLSNKKFNFRWLEKTVIKRLK